MKYSFQETIAISATEFYLLRQQAEDKDLFDKATNWMNRKKFTCDTTKGTTCNIDGMHSSFVSYDWESDYIDAPNHVFHDFFRGILLNKYSRLIRLVDTE